MLTLYRRHRKQCEHLQKGRSYRRCRCPIWVEGTVGGQSIRKSIGLTNWEKAQVRIARWEAEEEIRPEPELVTVEKTCTAFITDAASRELQESTLKKYRQLTKQMCAFSKKTGRLYIRQWDLETLRAFRAIWQDNGLSVVKKLERLRALFRFAHESGWIPENPAPKIRNPTVKQKPTMPFSREEFVRILAACDEYTDCYGRTGQRNARRLKALVLLLRYSGLRIGDAAACRVDRLDGQRLFLYTAKSGTPVCCKLPAFVTTALEAIQESPTQSYWFWSGASKVESNTDIWRRKLTRLFQLAGVEGGHPHRFRDTFAVELLLAGVALQQVSILLGHSSIRITERHYAPWVRARQQQLDADLERAWAADPLTPTLAVGLGRKPVGRENVPETNRTYPVHEKTDAVN